MARVSGVKPQAKRPDTVPSGTVTFLFSDIEGSTQRWEAHREGMEAAVERHNEILHREIEHHNGYIFKTVGDAFCAAFGSVRNAVDAAIAAQRELTKEDFSAVDSLRVRMGLHTGQAVERGGDYLGPDVNRVARLMSIGHGGQVLISGAVHELIEDSLPDGVSLVDLGLRRLKDLTQPEQVWQVTLVGLPADFPPLNSLDARPNNLPMHVTAFIGRERDLDDVKTLLGKHRLVTITGSGGVGKTRVALQVGADLMDRFPNGVWFADLAPITDPELVASVVASAVGMTQVEGRRVDEAIPQWLKRKHSLLILDNCEHLLSTIAPLADAIHRNAPNVRMLATSRQALGIAGEAAHRLPSLAVPERWSDLRADDALQYGAIAVFVDRAALADTRFVLTDDNAPTVAQICRHLDGIPLAIELAAARVKVLSIANLAQRLSERFKVLTSGSRTALPRQKTLGALIDWSYNLLSPQEGTLFNRLGIFAGGFTLDAATAVCSENGVDEGDILDLLSSLTDKSLVVADTGGERERYHLLESTRAYALGKLEAKDERDKVARQHAEYFRDRARAADESYGMGSSLAWFADVELELDNYRAALEWALTQGNDAVLGGAIAGALVFLWYRGGLQTEGRYWVRLALERLDEAEHPRVAARLLGTFSTLHTARARVEASQRAIRLYQTAGDDLGAARVRVALASGLAQMGRLDEAKEECLLALATLRERGDKSEIAMCLCNQAAILWEQGDMAAGRDLFAQATATYKALGDELGSASTLGDLADLEFADGHPREALRLVSECLEVHLRCGVEVFDLAQYRSNSAVYRIALGDLDGARTSARDGLQYARQAQARHLIATALQHHALIMALQGELPGAARLRGYNDAQLKELGVDREPTEKWGYDKLMVALREHLSEAEIEKLAAEGAAWSEDQAVEEALKV